LAWQPGAAGLPRDKEYGFALQVIMHVYASGYRNWSFDK